jgi:hypothetical protein
MVTEAPGAVAQEGRRPPSSIRAVSAVVICGLVVAGLYYGTLLNCCSAGFFAPVPHGLTFNSMLLHLLNGAFDVDPQAIGDEGSLRNGLVYTYFGIVPAALRLPFLLSPDFATADFTRLSCLTAVLAMAAFKTASALTVWRANGTSQCRVLLALFIVAILVGGPQIQFLRALIYQEVILWAGAFAAGFVYFVLRGYYSPRGFTAGILAALAVLAGLCLLTRVSTALGLYVAFGLLWLHLAWVRLRKPDFGPSHVVALASLLAPVLILTVFVAAAGFINFERWGSPFLFTDPYAYLWPLVHNAPDRLLRHERYGDFNLVRIGYALIYYFFPVWVLRSADGNLLWSAFQQRTIDSVELPPSSFFVSDPLIIGLTVFALVQLARRREVFSRPVVVLPVLIGLLVPIFLILTLSSMTFRYRMEFYPCFELSAFLGFGMLLSRQAQPPVLSFAAATIVGVIASHASWALYMLTPFGPAHEVMGNMDVISFYRSWFH